MSSYFLIFSVHHKSSILILILLLLLIIYDREDEYHRIVEKGPAPPSDDPLLRWCLVAKDQD